nr:SWIM zinc finger family protein [Streptomyces sp. DSM 40484]
MSPTDQPGTEGERPPDTSRATTGERTPGASGAEGRAADDEGTPPADVPADAQVDVQVDVPSSAHSPRPAAGGTRPADAARRALREARRAEAASQEPVPAPQPPGTSPASKAAPPAVVHPTRRRPTEGTAAPSGPRPASSGPRPGDAARAAIRRAADRSGGAAATEPEGEGQGGSQGYLAATQPNPRGTRPLSAATESPDGPSDVTASPRATRASGVTGPGAPTGDSDVTVAGLSGRASDASATESAEGSSDEVSVSGSTAAEPETDGSSGASRPGDVAREALRAARSQAERERTAPQDKGIGASRKRRGGSAVTAVGPRPAGPRPAGPSREAAAQVRELAAMLGNSLDLSSRLDREEQADESDTGPNPTRPATTSAPGMREGTDDGEGTGDGAGTGTGTNAGADVGAGLGADPAPGGADAAHVRVHPEPVPGVPGIPVPGVSADPPAAAQRSAPVAGRSMAAPARDGELRRTFPPPPPARTPRASGFAETWWGNAWVAALEEMALDAARLGRGKAYAGEGHVDAVTVTPGLVLAYVHGSRPRPYRVQIRMRTLPDDDWERFLDAAAERPSHIAALLDKELPQALADCGVELLPGPGDLVPRCSCPDSGHPCKHAAALCYQTARLLDEDPFVLLLLRGRGERELLDELSRRNATLAARSARAAEEPALPGVPAREAVERRVRAPLPAPLPPPAHPEQPPAYPASPGGPDPFALDQLATDAAARAHALLTTGRDPLAELTLWQDAVRLAATRPGSGLTATTRALYADLATATRRTPADLARAVAAWRQGGLEGLAVLEEAWDPPAGRFDRARPLLLAADFPAFRPWHNHLTHPHGHIQLRLGHDGLWYAYESEPGHDDWWPRGTPDLDPVGALTGLGSPTDV